MKKITLYTLLIAGIAVQATCKKDTNTPPEPQQIIQTDQAKKELLCRTWCRLQDIVDSDTPPYGTDTINYSIDSLTANWIIYYKNGTYISYNWHNNNAKDTIVTKGIWNFNQDYSQLNTQLTEVNEKQITGGVRAEIVLELTETVLKIKSSPKAGGGHSIYIPCKRGE